MPVAERGNQWDAETGTAGMRQTPRPAVHHPMDGHIRRGGRHHETTRGFHDRPSAPRIQGGVMADEARNHIHYLADYCAARTKDAVLGRYEWLEPLCESEIERLMLVGLIGAAETYDQTERAGFDYSRGDEEPDCDEYLDTMTAIEYEQFGKTLLFQIRPQHRVGQYRLDFRVRCARVDYRGRDHWRWMNIAVECDGHDFHERTKEQARRDRARDRFLTAEGYRVLRFTGSEIVKDPWECARQVFELADRFFYDELRGAAS
jgi:very-short-patch-repair endonuclease